MRFLRKSLVILLLLCALGSFYLFRSEPTSGLRNVLLEKQAAVKRQPTAGPLRVSPANPLYFADRNGKTIYLTGSHNWNNLQDVDPPFLANEVGQLSDPGPGPFPKFDFAEHLRFLIKENHNFTRMWMCEEAAWVPWIVKKQTIQPLPYARTGPGTALDGKPKFDLTKFDPEYFDRLHSRVKAAADSGIYVSVMLFNGWSVETKGMPPMTKVWRGHPFNRANNINGIDGDPNGDEEGTESHTLQVADVTAIQESYVRKVVATLNDLDNVIWEISNESDSSSVQWQYHMIGFIRRCEASLPQQHPVGMTPCYPGDDNAQVFNSPADWISTGSRTPWEVPTGDGRKVLLWDSDHLAYLRRDRAWVWKSFTRGLNPIFMDAVENPKWEPVRQAMGATLVYANRLDLSATRPRQDLTSTGYCLAQPGEKYVIYAPLELPWLENRRFIRRLTIPARNVRRLFETKVTVDLTSHHGAFRVEWMHPRDGEIKPAPSITGGAKVTLTAPFRGDAVLYLERESSG